MSTDPVKDRLRDLHHIESPGRVGKPVEETLVEVLEGGDDGAGDRSGEPPRGN